MAPRGERHPPSRGRHAGPDGRPPPSFRVVVASGVAVLVVVVFVAALAVGARPSAAQPGDRLGFVRHGHGGGGMAVVTVRCPSERVLGVELRRADGGVLWRIVSRKGSIDDRYVVGGEPPTGFETDVALAAPVPPAEPLVVTVRLSRRGPDTVTDQAGVVPEEIPERGVLHRGAVVRADGFERRALANVHCPSDADDLNGITVAFGAAAAAVLVTYGMLVRRWWHGRSPGHR